MGVVYRSDWLNNILNDFHFPFFHLLMFRFLERLEMEHPKMWTSWRKEDGLSTMMNEVKLWKRAPQWTMSVRKTTEI